MTYRENALAFCRYIANVYSNDNTKIDFLIADNYIKLFFYFNWQRPFDTGNITDELNSALKAFKLKTMCEFYMRLNNVEAEYYNMCWTFFSYDMLGKYYR